MANYQTTFNMAQLATWAEARELAKVLSAGPIVVGGGVQAESKDNSSSGIYLPDWNGGPDGFLEPAHTDDRTGTEYFFLHFRFKNGAEGMNVGLIHDKMKRYPTSPGYVMNGFAEEARELGRP